MCWVVNLYTNKTGILMPNSELISQLNKYERVCLCLLHSSSSSSHILFQHINSAWHKKLYNFISNFWWIPFLIQSKYDHHIYIYISLHTHGQIDFIWFPQIGMALYNLYILCMCLGKATGSLFVHQIATQSYIKMVISN